MYNFFYDKPIVGRDLWGGRYLTGAPSWPGGRGWGCWPGLGALLRSPPHVA